MYYDRIVDVSKGTICIYSESTDDSSIQTQLGEWEDAGHLVILQPVKDCADREPCIRLLGPVPVPGTKT